MRDRKEKDYFILRMLRSLMVPSIISSIGFAFADMADALVVGQRMGETGLAAIGLCLPIFMLINFFMDGLGIGGSIRFSQKLAGGDLEDARDCFNRIWQSVLAAGALIAVLSNIFAPQILKCLGAASEGSVLYSACERYMRIITAGAPLMMLNVVFANFLRNDNNAALAARGFLIGNIADVSLNIVFVILFDMGTTGAALATIIGSAIAICVYLPGIKKADILKIKCVKPNIREVSYCFKTGFSTSAQYIFRFVFFLVINRIMIRMGGEDGAAVFDVVYNASFFIIYLYNGISEAAQPLVSTFDGEHSNNDCKYVLWLEKRCGFFIGGFMAIVMFIFARLVCKMFGVSEDAVPLAMYALRIYCCGFLFLGLNIIYEKYYQAKENTAYAFFITILRNFAILIPSTLILSLFGIKHIWLTFPLTEFISYFLFKLYSNIKKEPEFDEGRILRMVITQEESSTTEMLEKSSTFASQWNASEHQKYFVTLIIEEICMSIVRNALRKVKDGKIRVTLVALENGEFMLHILDNAVVFNPFSLKAAKVSAEKEFDIDEISMTIIKKKTKQFIYRQYNGFNSLTVRI